MPPSLTRSGDELQVSLSGLSWGGELEAARDSIKEIAGRRWDPDNKVWVLPLDAGAAERVVRTIRPKMDKATEEWFRGERAEYTERLTTPLPPDAKLMVPWGHQRCEWQPEEVNGVKFDGCIDYQRAAVDQMVTQQRQILGDDMGLGKSLTALTAVEEWRLRNPRVDGTLEEGPRLIICPNSVKGSWLREIKRWLPPETPVVVIEGKWTPKKRHAVLEEAIQNNAWVITNWEAIRIEKVKRKTRTGGTVTEKVMKETLYSKTEWLAVIADEIHRAKNYRAKQTIGLWRVRSKFNLNFGLTGTAIQNAPNELWPLLRWGWPEQYNTNGTATAPKIAYWYFYKQYVDSYEDPNGRDVVIGVKEPDRLRFELVNRLTRRTQGQVRDKLPGHRRIFYPVNLTEAQRKLYLAAEKKMWLEIREKAEAGDPLAARTIEQAGSDTHRLVRIANGAARVVRLLQIIETPALLGGPNDSALFEDFSDHLGDSRPNQWVCFTKYNETPEYLAEYLTDKTRFPGLSIGIYTGEVSTIERTRLEDKFQSGSLDVMIGTLDAMREGITLTNAHLGYFLTRAWVPDWNEQGEGRYANRLGQQYPSTTYIPLARLDDETPTVAETKVQEKNKTKERIVRDVVNKDEIEEVVR